MRGSLAARAKAEWPAWVAVLFIVALPIRRSAEIIIVVFALAMPFLWFSREHGPRAREVFRFVLPFFLCFWLPMLFSALDTAYPYKSWTLVLADIRFLMVAVSMGVLLSSPARRNVVLKWSALIILFWAIDGWVQLAFGYDVFGVPMHEERLNALFFRKHQFYGLLLAMLSPLLLEYARRNWPPWVWALCFAVLIGAVLISGMRAGWLAVFIAMVVYLVMLIRDGSSRLRKVAILVPAVSLVMVAVAYFSSPLLQERVSETLAISDGSLQALDEASSYRVPIFVTAMRMFSAHPVNGVGVRAFHKVYPEYADPDDPHLFHPHGPPGASHAHNVVLESMSDMGIIGLGLLLTGWLLAWRFWKSASERVREESWPYVFSLGLIYFPLNSHASLWGMYMACIIWFLIGLWASCVGEEGAGEDRPPVAA